MYIQSNITVLMSKIGNALKRLRKQRGWTQRELARRARLALVTIGQIEADMRKTPTLDTRKKLAKALKVPVTALLD
jgi:transcriptional regulator with XRE-family HTH domain